MKNYLILTLCLLGLCCSCPIQRTPTLTAAENETNQISLKEWTARSDAPGSWRLDGGDWRLAYAYSQQSGIEMTCFERTGENGVSYLAEPVGILPLENAESRPVSNDWKRVDDQAKIIDYGGRPALQISITVESFPFQVTLHAVAFPGCSVIRQGFTIRNLSDEPQANLKYCPFSLPLQKIESSAPFRVDWIRGGNPTPDQGEIVSQILDIARPESQNIEFTGHMTQEFLPLAVLQREAEPFDGIMAEVDYAATWTIKIQRSESGIAFRFEIDPESLQTLPEKSRIETPVLTLAVFNGNRDHLMKTLYDWQYAYLWDYTNPDYYAKLRSCSNWVFCSRILQEQYLYRLYGMDLKDVSAFQRVGYEVIWGDAGWSSYPGYPPDGYGSVFSNTYEGPDYRISGRYFERAGLKRLLWFAGQPSLGLLRSKEGAWGDFEWRTDGLGLNSFEEEQRFKKRVRDYLTENPDRSFHTCSGGSRYAHTFDIARYGNYHYFSDLGRGNNLNYYFSYFETPDRWGDSLSFINRDYIMNGTRAKLAMVPLPCNIFNEAAIEAGRIDLAVYRYLRREGVAGRGAYVYHPEVTGDPENLYFQRVSGDHKRSLIIPFVRPSDKAVLFPRGLLDEENYRVDFQEQPRTFVKTGRELMERGIDLSNSPEGELIYLNLPDYPGASALRAAEEKNQAVRDGAADRIAPPGSAVSRRENNIGAEGVAVYWTASDSSSPVDYYEIARDGVLVGENSSGRYWFDYSSSWNPKSAYSVRAVGRGQKSEWTIARAIDDEAQRSSAMGNHGEKMAENGWFAETSADLKTFVPMKWVPCPKLPYGDFGGTPNQPGGIDGYWEGGRCARVGRGWQQASPDAASVRGYAVPRDGDYLISGRAMKEWYHRAAGTDLTVSVMLNDETLIRQKLAKNDLYGLGHQLTVSAKKGDKIRFVVEPNDPESGAPAHFDENADIVGWIPAVELLSEKTSDSANKAAPQEKSGGEFSGLFYNVGGEAYADETKQSWQADAHCLSGERFTITSSSEKPRLGDMTDPALWLTARKGESIRYAVPLSPGLYSVKLSFVEPEYVWRDSRLMTVSINGTTLDENLDLTARQVKDDPVIHRLYRYQQPNQDGKLEIAVEASSGEAVLSAIEIQPENRSRVLINCGSDSDFVDWSGDIWKKDVHFSGGEKASFPIDALKQATPTLYDGGLYATGRQGKEFEYRVPLAAASYSVHLKFAELVLGQPGERPIEIAINGKIYETGWDAADYVQEVNESSDIRFNGISPVNGFINVKIRALGQNPAIVQSLEFD